MPQPARHPVPDHRPTDCPTDHKPHLGTYRGSRITGAGTGQMHEDGAAGRPATPPHPRREVVAAGQSGGGGQQRGISGQ
jgi:hypothetical protein